MDRPALSEPTDDSALRRHVILADVLGLLTVPIGPLMMLGAAALASDQGWWDTGPAAEVLVLSVLCGLHLAIALSTIVVSRRARRRLAAPGSIHDRGMRAATSMGIRALVVGLVVLGALTLGPFRRLQVEWACDMRGLSVPEIEARVSHPHQSVRWSALHALAATGTPDALEALVRFDWDPWNDGGSVDWAGVRQLCLMDCLKGDPGNAHRIVSLLEARAIPIERAVDTLGALMGVPAGSMDALVRLTDHPLFGGNAVQVLERLAQHVPSGRRPPFECGHARRGYEYQRRIDPAAPAAARSALDALAAEGITLPGPAPSK